MKKYLGGSLAVVLFLFGFSTTYAQETISENITLQTGWNIVSTPKVLDSHEFSAPATAENFDVFLLDASQPTGWATMAMVGQTEFTPLYGYFIQNKTGAEQTLTFNYDTDLAPNEQLFERTFSTAGWYSIGVANDEYAKPRGDTRGDRNTPSKVLSLLEGKYDTVIDFTDADFGVNRDSVELSDPWKAVVPVDIDTLNDFRETKGYAVYIKEADARYSGFQNSAGSTGGGETEEEALLTVSTQFNPIDEYIIGGTSLAFELQAGKENIVLDELVVKVVSSTGTVSELVDRVRLGSATWDELSENGTEASYVLDFDSTVALVAGEKREFIATVYFEDDLPFVFNNETFQIIIGDAEIAQWKITSGAEPVDTDLIQGNASTLANQVFISGALIEYVYFSNDFRGETPFEIEVELEAVVRGDYEYPEVNTFNTVTAQGNAYGLVYEITGPTGSFITTDIVDFDPRDIDSRSKSIEYDLRFTVEADKPGTYTFTVLDIQLLDEEGVAVSALVQPDILAEDFQTTFTIADPRDSLSGVAALNEFDLNVSPEPELSVGSQDVVLAEATAEFIDGDAIVDSLRIALPSAPAGVSLFEAFDSFSLWVDGDKITEVEATEGNFLGAENTEILFSNLSLYAAQDETVEMVIAADIAIAEEGNWYGEYELIVTELIFKNAVVETHSVTNFDDISPSSGVNFEIVELVEELIFRSSANDPDSAVLLLDESRDSGPFGVFAYEIDTADSTIEIEIEELAVTVEVSGTSFNDIVDDAVLVVDGIEISDYQVIGGDSQTAILTFNVDSSVYVEAGNSIDVWLELEFNALDEENENTTIMAAVTSANAQATGAVGHDDIAPTDLKGAVFGETHTLITEGILVPADGVSTAVQTFGENDTIGEFEIEFDVTALENDFYIFASASTTGAGLYRGAGFTVDGGSTSGVIAAVLTSTADEDSADAFTVREGETETFTLTVSVDPDSTGQYRVTLDEIWFSDNPDGVTGADTFILFPASDFRTSFQAIIN